jgi:hypothetical protein
MKHPSGLKSIARSDSAASCAADRGVPIDDFDYTTL